MTKDRRLGRGLAALLGTPMEEEDIVDGSAIAASANSSGDKARSGNAIVPSTGNGEGAARASSTATPPASPQQPIVEPMPTEPLANKSSTGLKIHAPPGVTGTGLTGTGVTGSVPLGARAAKRPNQGGVHSQSSSQATSTPATSTTRSLEIEVAEIDNNPFQPRRRFNPEEIASLAESIREHQQLQPILVRQVGNRYQLISGERRLRATIHAGMKTIRAEVREADDRLVAELAIVENLQRKDLDAIEKAMSFRRYIDEHRCTQEDLARRLKIDRSTIANLMRLLELPAQIQNWVQIEKLTAGHARTLLPLGDETQQLEFARRIMEEAWTVRDTERQVSEQLAVEDGIKLVGSISPRGSRKRSTPQLASLEQQMRLALGTQTEIRQSATGRGKIVISFANADEFERLCALICPQLEQKVA